LVISKQAAGRQERVIITSAAVDLSAPRISLLLLTSKHTHIVCYAPYQEFARPGEQYLSHVAAEQAQNELITCFASTVLQKQPRVSTSMPQFLSDEKYYSSCLPLPHDS
jgi:hypothetical protein